MSTGLGLHIIIKPLWSAGTVININELWAVLQVYQCCTRSFIRPTHLQIHPWQDSALSELTSPHLHQLQQFPPPFPFSSSSSPKLTPPLAVTHSTVRLPATAMSFKIPKIDLFVPAISFKNRRVKTLILVRAPAAFFTFLNHAALLFSTLIVGCFVYALLYVNPS